MLQQLTACWKIWEGRRDGPWTRSKKIGSGVCRSNYRDGLASLFVISYTPTATPAATAATTTMPIVDVKNDPAADPAPACPVAAGPASAAAVTPIPAATICPGVNGMTRL